MTLKLSLIVMSHLSDVQEEISMGIAEQAPTNNRINFVKWLINKFDGNLNQDVDADVLWEEFKTTRFYTND